MRDHSRERTDNRWRGNDGPTPLKCNNRLIRGERSKGTALTGHSGYRICADHGEMTLRSESREFRCQLLSSKTKK